MAILLNDCEQFQYEAFCDEHGQTFSYEAMHLRLLGPQGSVQTLHYHHIKHSYIDAVPRNNMAMFEFGELTSNEF